MFWESLSRRASVCLKRVMGMRRSARFPTIVEVETTTDGTAAGFGGGAMTAFGACAVEGAEVGAVLDLAEVEDGAVLCIYDDTTMIKK